MILFVVVLLLYIRETGVIQGNAVRSIHPPWLLSHRQAQGLYCIYGT